MGHSRLAWLPAIPLLLAVVATHVQAQTFRSGVEDAARQCDVGRLTVLRPLSAAEKEVALRRSWTAFSRAYETGQKAIAAMQGKATWFGPDTAEKSAGQFLELTGKCQAAFESVLAVGGDASLVLAAEETAGDSIALNYLFSNGANPAARNPAYNSATFGMLALRTLAQFDFAGRQDKLDAYLKVLIPRMAPLKGLKDKSGLPVVYYALGLDPLIRLSSNQKTVDVIIKRIAEAGADVGAPWKQAYVSGEQRAWPLYQGSDPEVLSLLRGH